MKASIKITFTEGTAEEVQELTDAITLLLIEHGVNVAEVNFL